MDGRIPTNRGPMTPEQIGEFVMLRSYGAQRDMGISPERLGRFYDVEKLEPLYRAQHGIVDLSTEELGRVGQ